MTRVHTTKNATSCFRVVCEYGIWPQAFGFDFWIPKEEEEGSLEEIYS